LGWAEAPVSPIQVAMQRTVVSTNSTDNNAMHLRNP
jgi:hypothetical protein